MLTMQGDNGADPFGGWGADPPGPDTPISMAVSEGELGDEPAPAPALAPAPDVPIAARPAAPLQQMPPEAFGVPIPAAGAMPPNDPRGRAMMVHPQQPAYGPPGAMTAPGYHPVAMQMGTMANEGSHMLGLSALAVGVGALVGWRYGGPYGGIAGGLLGGALVNGYRALSYYKEGTAEGDKEAAVSATYAALTTAVGGYLIATKAKTPEPEADRLRANPDEDDEPAIEPSGPCALRPVGPSLLPPEGAWEEESAEDDG